MDHPKAGSTSESSKIMLFTNGIDQAPRGGRGLLCKLNCDILEDLFGDDLVLCEIPKAKVQGLNSTLSAFRGRIDGLNNSTIDRALQTLAQLNIQKLFVDGSGFGEFVSAVKHRFPQIQITTFFHNAEASFFWGALRSSRSLRAIAVLCVNYLAERKAVRYSDNIICLSDRDSQLLLRIYGRGATHISPLAMHDRADSSAHRKHSELAAPYALFIGGGFYANRAGVQWYVDHVVPRIDIKTCIVGGGFEGIETPPAHREKVVFVGAVDSVVDWYRNAQFVVAPVFDGSGMKTKVAEALMFGKRVVGTPEAFSGYQGTVEQAGWECLNAADFIAAIGIAQHSIVDSFDPKLRALYESSYSYAAARSRMADILCASGESAR